MWSKSSTVLAFGAWLSVFGVSWLAVMRQIPLDWLTAFCWAFFFIVALVSSAVASANPSKGSRR